MASLLNDDIFGVIGSPNALEGLIGLIGEESSFMATGELISLSWEVAVASSVIKGNLVRIVL